MCVWECVCVCVCVGVWECVCVCVCVDALDKSAVLSFLKCCYINKEMHLNKRVHTGI